MRIVIDMQGAQTESRFRGIGGYTVALSKAIVRNRGEHEIVLALSGLFPEAIESIRAAFDGLLPQENIRVWNAPGPVCEGQPGNDARRETAEILREAFLASLRPDVILISSLFEGYLDDAVTSIGRFDTSTPVAVILYELPPLLNSDHDLKPYPSYKQHCLSKIESLNRAALHLATSEFTRYESLEVLDSSATKIVTISSSLNNPIQARIGGDETASALCAKHGIDRPFVLCTGGAVECKDLHRLIEAYATLPAGLRASHRLVLSSKMNDVDIARLKDFARSAGLKDYELVLTSFVSDRELVQLYNFCQLFVLTSWHEDFALPELEAMAYGAPVIDSNTSSPPEVINLGDAPFDQFDVGTISAKLTQVLEDQAFRNVLPGHGLCEVKKASWDEMAKRAITAMEGLHSRRHAPLSNGPSEGPRPKLAYVSPLPSERSGIADYSAELLPELATYYEIEVITTQETIDSPWIIANCRPRSVQWFTEHADDYGRVLYHFGNSPFHQHMFNLLKTVPGVVVLHDFFLSGLLVHADFTGFAPGKWTQELYLSHGYKALYDRFHANDISDVVWKYPCSLSVMQDSQGLIVHSQNSLRLAHQWYGGEPSDWSIIPHMRDSRISTDRADARKALGLGAEDFLVCAFGMLGPAKLNHRLLNAWLKSNLGLSNACHLAFVGENHGGEYGQKLLDTISRAKAKGNICITGWADREAFHQYLAAADAAVQLRTLSRGETSGTVLDCMNYGLPTIVNANGSMADLDAKVVWKIPDEFEDGELIDALEKLWRSPKLRSQFGESARERILTHHAPDDCARQYAEAIEAFYARTAQGLPALIKSLADKSDLAFSEAELIQLAGTLGHNHPPSILTKRLYLDITATCRNDLKTGIERVARALTISLLQKPPLGYRIEPVYLSDLGGKWHYRTASRYTLSLLGCPKEVLPDVMVEPVSGDLVLGLDLSGDILIEADRSGLFESFRNNGVVVYFLVHDLLPIRMPDVFPPGSDVSHERWLNVITKFDGAVCVSRSVAADLADWVKGNATCRRKQRHFRIAWSHHGFDVTSSAPTTGMPKKAAQVLEQLNSRRSFLMVGTIEPRKGYLQTIDAFSQLWNANVNVNLVIVGPEGWKGLPNKKRRDIPETIERLRTHPELGKRLFWLEGISDEYLERVYSSSSCLIAASYGEGFGLPLVEAAQYGIPIIARDIPVFREVLGSSAHFFTGNLPEDISSSIVSYIDGFYENKASVSCQSWADSAQNLANIVCDFGFSEDNKSHYGIMHY